MLKLSTYSSQGGTCEPRFVSTFHPLWLVHTQSAVLTEMGLIVKNFPFICKTEIDRGSMLDTHWDLLLNVFSPTKFTLNVPHMLLVKDGESVKDVWSGPVACGLLFKRIKRKVRI